MTNPAADIAELLENDLIATRGVNLFVSRMPERDQSRGIPHEVASIVHSGGTTINPRWNRDVVILQIMVRSDINDPEGGYNFTYSIKNSLLGKNPVTINGSLYSSFNVEGDINELGDDSTGRSRFTLRIRVTRDNFTGSSRDNL